MAAYFWFAGWKPIGYGLAVAWVPCFLFNIVSNMGVATANRMQEVQKASLQKAAFTEIQKGRDESGENKLKFFLQQQQKLTAEFDLATKTEVRGWKVTAVPASTAALDKLVAEKQAGARP